MSNETIQRLTMALTMIGNLPLEFNTRARAIAQEAVGTPPPGGWRDPLTEAEIHKVLYRQELWNIKPTEQEKSVNTNTTAPQEENTYQPPQIDMIPVESSNIESVGHDGKETLRVTFKSSGSYDYPGITEAEFFDLVNSASVGKAYNALTRACGIKGIKL